MPANYKSIVPAKPRAKRPRLVSYWTLAAFAVLVLIPLVLAFPKQYLLRQAEQAKLGDIVAVTYLTNFLMADQDNLQLRTLLAEHKIFRGELSDVPSLLEPVLHSSDADWQAQGSLVMYKYVTKQYSLSQQGSAQQAELMKRRHAEFLQVVAHPWPVDTLIYLAGQATGLHERDIGIRLYRTIMDTSKTYSAPWCADMAARLLGEGDYEFAADLYFIAREKESSLAGQREYLIAGIRALMSDSLFAKAMQAADKHLGSLEDDPETLDFLVKAARAANDQKRAARYARQMLHLSWLDRAYIWFGHLNLGLIATADAAPLSQASAQSSGMGAYDEKKYRLAYEVFLENRNVADAYRVADAAVRQRPKDAGWHGRLAQVAEWTNRPEIALREWLWLLRHNGGEPALLAVLRIAPALDDYDAALEAWTMKAAVQPLNEEQWNAVADLFEKTGRQSEGIRFLEARYGAEHSPLLLEIAARMAQRSGDDDYAIGLYLRLLKLHGYRSEWRLKIANLYVQKGQYQKAYDLLRRDTGSVDKNDVAYWKMLADLAWQLQRDDDAVKDYRRLASSGNLAGEDFSRLSNLLRKSKPEELAALAESTYRKSGDPQMLMQALDIYVARHDLVAQKRLFEAAADRKVDLSGNSHFLLLRASYLRASGAFQAAHALCLRAVALVPDDPNTVNVILWLLVEAHDQAALRQMIAQITARGDQQNPIYWGAFAAAYQALEQPARAVAYYARQTNQSGQDFLWMVNYAEALEHDRQPGMALRVRQQAWLKLRGKLHDKRVRPPFSADMLAAARLETMNQPGDAGAALVRSVLRQDRLVKHDVVNDDQTNELILGWAVSGEQSFSAKAWLWRSYGHSLTQPVWADAQVALAEADTGRLDYLLADRSDGMPVVIRHDAAKTLNEAGYAESIAFSGLTADPGNNEAHLRLSEDAMAHAGYVNFELRRQQSARLYRTVQLGQIETPVGRNLRMGVEFRHAQQSDSTPQDFHSVQQTEKIAGVNLKHHSDFGDAEVGVRRREEFANRNEAHASYAMNVTPHAHLKFGAEYHAEANESNDLLVFGMRDQAEVGLNYAFTTRDYLSIDPRYARYRTQTGNFLGSGRNLYWEVGHHVNPDYPDLRVGLLGIHERFTTDRAAAFALPRDQNLYGLCFGDADDYHRAYTKAWHPYFDACGTSNNVAGGGYIAKLGLGGSVAGHDRLAVTLRQEQGGVKIVSGLERELRLSYRHFFD